MRSYTPSWKRVRSSSPRRSSNARRNRVHHRVLIARAVVLEKYGTDLRAALAVARKARTVSKNEPADIRALVLD